MRFYTIIVLLALISYPVCSQVAALQNEPRGSLRYNGYKNGDLTTPIVIQLRGRQKPFESTKFAHFMASPPGRILRVGIGGGLMTWGAVKGWNDGGAL